MQAFTFLSPTQAPSPTTSSCPRTSRSVPSCTDEGFSVSSPTPSCSERFPSADEEEEVPFITKRYKASCLLHPRSVRNVFTAATGLLFLLSSCYLQDPTHELLHALPPPHPLSDGITTCVVIAGGVISDVTHHTLNAYWCKKVTM